ncbi:MAG: hypothetical protein NTY87_09885 [Planctomycetia bacterium]|nr:hypothetical protein [Planctomycetia bacterium]RLT15079.1 MAG: hypothetical protein DWI25_03230 [Planctomycetota bacterium]
MLQKNRLQPPRSSKADPIRADLASSDVIAAGSAVQTDCVVSSARSRNRLFVSAEDFDCTGILTGIDPCESNYWWMPELYGPENAVAGVASGSLKTVGSQLETALRGPSHAALPNRSRTPTAA